MFNAGFNPLFNTRISTQRGYGPFGGYNNFQMSQSLSPMGKGMLFGQLGMGLTNIFFGIRNAKAGNNATFNAGAYGTLNAANEAALSAENKKLNADDQITSLKAAFPNNKIVKLGDGKFGIAGKDGGFEKVGTFEELVAAATKKKTEET